MNQNLRFLDLDEEQRASFRLRPLPKLVRFAKDQHLYKLTEFGLVNPAKPKNFYYGILASLESFQGGRSGGARL